MGAFLHALIIVNNLVYYKLPNRFKKDGLYIKLN
jgi:hypothetical protein